MAVAVTMTEDQILAEFRAADALLEGHFILSSGLRSPRYLQCARVLMRFVFGREFRVIQSEGDVASWRLWRRWGDPFLTGKLERLAVGYLSAAAIGRAEPGRAQLGIHSGAHGPCGHRPAVVRQGEGRA